MEKKETFWTRLGAGKLPSMDINTAVEIDSESVKRAATLLFIVVVLCIVSFFVIRKKLA